VNENELHGNLFEILEQATVETGRLFNVGAAAREVPKGFPSFARLLLATLQMQLAKQQRWA
jgi:hypothetical protein